jgi:O-succinylbenzoic acid--CoA ligase
MLARLLDTGIAPPASLRHVLIGGAALTQTLFDRATPPAGRSTRATA